VLVLVFVFQTPSSDNARDNKGHRYHRRSKGELRVSIDREKITARSQLSWGGGSFWGAKEKAGDWSVDLDPLIATFAFPRYRRKYSGLRSIKSIINLVRGVKNQKEEREAHGLTPSFFSLNLPVDEHAFSFGQAFRSNRIESSCSIPSVSRIRYTENHLDRVLPGTVYLSPRSYSEERWRGEVWDLHSIRFANQEDPQGKEPCVVRRFTPQQWVVFSEGDCDAGSKKLR